MRQDNRPFGQRGRLAPLAAYPVFQLVVQPSPVLNLSARRWCRAALDAVPEATAERSADRQRVANSILDRAGVARTPRHRTRTWLGLR